MFDYSLMDYEKDDEQIINFENRNISRKSRVERFTKLTNIRKSRIAARSRMPIRVPMRIPTTFGGFGAGAAVAIAPMAVMATSMSIGLRLKEYSFDSGALQSDIKGLTDLVVSETPTILSIAAFGAAEAAVSGKFSGSAGSFAAKRFGRVGGGIAGKAVSMAAGFISYEVSNLVMKPIQESLGQYVAESRSTGLMSSIVKGSVSQAEAAIRNIAAGGKLSAEEIAKKLPTGIAGMTTKQIQEARREMKRALSETEGGFMTSLKQGNLMKWSETKENQAGLTQIANELTNRRMNVLADINENNKMIIEFYTRE